MSFRIGADQDRFHKIVRGKVRQNLRQYISNEKLLGKKGKDTVSIPVTQIDVPRFRFDDRKGGGVGQGDGDPGDPVSGQKGSGKGKAGSDPGEHVLEADVTIDELAEMLGEELELPRIEPKGKDRLRSEKARYTSVRKVGPESLKSFKRTYKEGLKRGIASGTYEPGKPVTPIKEDRRYRSQKVKEEDAVKAAIVYMMDVSGSMGEREKSIVRTETFWIDAWLRHHYKGLETRFIIHDTVAREVERDAFFSTAESGGTMISPAYDMCAEMIDRDYPSDQWNVYAFHFSDGDNWNEDDTVRAVDLLKFEVIPFVNMFGYGQVISNMGTGSFLISLQSGLSDEERLVTSVIDSPDEIPRSIKDFLGKGL